MYIVMDMGTTNTRLFLIKNSEVCDREKINMGCRNAVLQSREVLFSALREHLLTLLSRNSLNENEIERVVAFGMAGSEFGVAELSHVALPITAKGLSENMREFSVPEFTIAPVFVIPGVCVLGENGEVREIMRGEETEVIGLVNDIQENCVVLMPGTHCKSVTVSKNGEILKFISGMDGEMMQVLSENTILSSKCDVKLGNDLEWQIKGAEWCRENGLNSALLGVRTLQAKTSHTIEEISSFFVGAVLYPDIHNIIEKNPDCRFLVGGKKVLRVIYVNLLKHYGAKNVFELDGAEDLGVRGAILINELRG